MQRSKPEVHDRLDFEEQLEALVDAAEESDEIKKHEITDVLFTHANVSAGEEWG